MPQQTTTNNEKDNELKDENNSVQSTSDFSATTRDYPSFGWSNYAERLNGRFAMAGFLAIVLIEIFSRNNFLNWAGILK